MAEATKEDTKEAPKDTMHAGTQAAPDLGPAGLTSNPVTRELAEKGIAKPAPEANTQGEQSTVTVGEFDPEPGSTLVTDIPSEEDRQAQAEEQAKAANGALNPGSPAPASVAQQPNETADEAGERAAKADKASAKK